MFYKRFWLKSPPWNQHSPWKKAVPKGKSFSSHQFLGAILVSGGVNSFCFVLFSYPPLPVLLHFLTGFYLFTSPKNLGQPFCLQIGLHETIHHRVLLPDRSSCPGTNDIWSICNIWLWLKIGIKKSSGPLICNPTKYLWVPLPQTLSTPTSSRLAINMWTCWCVPRVRGES